MIAYALQALGAALAVAGVYLLAGLGWALVVAGVVVFAIGAVVDLGPEKPEEK